MSGHISVGGDPDFSVIKITNDDPKEVDPSLNPRTMQQAHEQLLLGTLGRIAGDAMKSQHVEDALTKTQDKTREALGKNLRADKDATTGKTDDQIAMEQRIHAISHDGIVPAEQGQRQLHALASIRSQLSEPPTTPRDDLESVNIRHFDNTHRA